MGNHPGPGDGRGRAKGHAAGQGRHRMRGAGVGPGERPLSARREVPSIAASVAGRGGGSGRGVAGGHRGAFGPAAGKWAAYRRAPFAGCSGCQRSQRAGTALGPADERGAGRRTASRDCAAASALCRGRTWPKRLRRASLRPPWWRPLPRRRRKRCRRRCCPAGSGCIPATT